MKKNNLDRSSWIIGGTTLIGLGIGIIFIPKNVFIFLASLFIGIGLGLVLAPIITSGKQKVEENGTCFETNENERINT